MGKKRCITHGMLLGIICGILTSFFDTLYMLAPNIYVPGAYPVFMAVFNICFWALAGTVAGCIISLVARYAAVFARSEHLCWAVFFLIPFGWGLVYFGLAETAVGGVYEYVFFFSPSFAFFWVLLVPGLLILRWARTAPAAPFTPFVFIPDIFVMVLLAHFSTNPAQIALVSLPYHAAEPFFAAIGISKPAYLFLAYCAGIAIFYGLYVYSFSRFKRFHPVPPAKTIKPQKFASRLTALFGALIVFVSAAYTINSLKRKPAAIFGQTEDSNAPPVILIVLDTVRAENLALYGYPAEHKHLDAFARDALVFDKCIANAPWTLPSHASLFTGLTPNEHGAHGDLDADNLRIGDFVGDPLPRSLDRTFTTLAEIFRGNNYRTIAVNANHFVLTKDFNFDQGFDIFESNGNTGDLNRKNPYRPINLFFFYLAYMPDLFMDTMRAGQITDRCIQLTESSAGAPFLLFVNYMDAHEAYCPPRPYNSFNTDRRFPHLFRLETHARRKFLKRYDRNAWNIFQLSQYDGAIAYLDVQLGRFFKHLKQIGIYDRALIIVTSDHGELFGEHGLYGHRAPMYEGVVRVPLIIKLPHSGQTGRDSTREIQLHDLFSTILNICGLPVPDDVSGKPFGSPGVPSVGEYENAHMRRHRVLYDGGYKYFYYERERPNELYDLRADPAEKNNLFDELPHIAERLDMKLEQWVEDHPPRYEYSEAGISDDVIRGLRALGYIQ